jgi:hypothetical protein
MERQTANLFVSDFLSFEEFDQVDRCKRTNSGTFFVVRNRDFGTQIGRMNHAIAHGLVFFVVTIFEIHPIVTRLCQSDKTVTI